jgi:hypothetical protein
VTLVQRGESTIGPVAVDGRTLTLVARTRAVRVGNGTWGGLHMRARPDHVEVLDSEGRHQVVRIPDVEGMLITAIALATAGCVLGLRLFNRARAR